MRKKGISLPVNAVVIIALAIFVLLMLAALFGGGFGQTRQANVATAWSKGCAKLNQYYNCRAENFDTGYDIDGDSVSDSFLKVCQAYFDDPNLNIEQCRDRCCGTTTRYGSGEGEKCTINSDCKPGLECVAGYCCDTSERAKEGESCSEKQCCQGLVCVDAKPNPTADSTGKRCCPSGSTFFNTTSHKCE